MLCRVALFCCVCVADFAVFVWFALIVFDLMCLCVVMCCFVIMLVCSLLFCVVSSALCYVLACYSVCC